MNKRGCFDTQLNSLEAKIFIDYKDVIEAPVDSGEQIGSVTYYLNEKYIREYPIVVSKTVDEKDMKWYFIKIIDCYINSKMA